MPIVKRVPLVAQTFAKPSINRVTGEIASVVAKFNNRPGLVRLASAPTTSFGRLATGVLCIDLCLAGGFMRSKGSMLYGEKSTGKSTISDLAIASAQREEPESVAVKIDIEGTHDPAWSRRLGVDQERLIVVEPESGEEAVDIADGMFRSQEVSIVVTDSIAMITPMKEITESSETSLVGVHARLIGNYLRRLNNAMLQERHRGHFPSLIHINQFRMKIGVVFGDPRTLPGGKALEFCTVQQVQTYNKEHKDEKSSEVIHNEHEVHITKDKTGGVLKVGKFKLLRSEEHTGYAPGTIPQAHTLVNYGTIAGVVSGKYTLGQYGSFRSFDDINRFLYENPVASRDLCKQVVDYFRRKWGVT